MRNQNGELVVARLWIVDERKTPVRNLLQIKTIVAIIRICCVYSRIARYRPMEIK